MYWLGRIKRDLVQGCILDCSICKVKAYSDKNLSDLWPAEFILEWLRCGDMRSFFTSSQSGQGAEGTTLRLYGCHLWSLRHWGHQSNSSREVRKSLCHCRRHYLHSHILHHLGFELQASTMLGMKRLRLDVFDSCNMKRLLKEPQGSTWKKLLAGVSFHVVRCVYAEHR